jgi:voltage-gated potassium channel
MPDRTARGRGFVRELLATFWLPAVLLTGALTIGTIGFHLIEGWSFFDSLYMAVTTLTTVGFREVHPLSPAGQAFTIGLIITGVMGVFTTIAIVAQHIMTKDFGEPLRRRRMERRIDGLRDHYIVCAYGRVGRATADELREQGVGYVVIDDEPTLERRLEESGAPYIVGDPSGEGVLQSAGIDRAKGLVSAVDSDAINVYITLTARTLNPKLFIVARASSPESVDQLYRAGADRVVSPYVLSGKRMAGLALQPAVVEFIEMLNVAPDMRLEEIVVRAGSALDGQAVGSAADVTILAVKKSGADLVPSPDTGMTLNAGDLVVALGPAKVLGELSKERT